jgi:hypothetical protein
MDLYTRTDNMTK